MKRIIALILSVLMLLSLAACGGEETPAPTEPAVAATVPIQETDEPTAAPTDAATEPGETVPVMAETVLADNENITFTVKSAEFSEHVGLQLQVQCVNKTDRNLMFSWDMVSVCGYMFDPMWAEEVAAGKTANSTVSFDTYQLEKMGIASVDEISFTLRIYDSENWMEAPLVQEAFTVYPTGLNAETLNLPPREEMGGQAVVAEDENVRFIIEWADAEDTEEYTVYVYMENKTDRNLMYAWDMVSVNGFMVDPFWSATVAAGKKAVDTVTFYRSDLEANGIETVSEIEFTLTVSDYDNWEADYLVNTVFTYLPVSVG